MKLFKKALFSFFMFAMFIGLCATPLQSLTGINPFVTLAMASIALFAAAIVKLGKPSNPFITQNGVQAEAWVDYIIKRFWKDNQVLAKFYNDDQYVLGGKVVHIPQPGSKPTVTKNPSSFPLTPAQRTDTEANYSLDWYVSTPSHITSAEKQEVSYDKMDSVMGEHLAVINERIAEEFFIKILDTMPAATNVKYTTGATAAAYVSGATGTRKIFMPADLKAARLALNLQNVPKEDRCALLDSNALDQLTTQLDTNQTNAFNQYYNAQTGQIGRLYGIDIFERSDVAQAAAALSGGNLAVNAWGAAGAATDLAVNMVWHKEAAARAIGEVLFYEQLNAPQYAGDIYNASIRFGGRRRRSDNTGIIAIVQG